VIDDRSANGYANSKWAGEVLLRETHDLCGLPSGTVNNHRFDLPCAGEPPIVLDIENHYAAGDPCLPQRRIGRTRVIKSFREQ
jgi:hypothetical protein